MSIAKIPMTNIKHPDYLDCSADWEKWRTVYNGGSDCIRTYLKKFSQLETDEDFKLRKDISYCPRFAGTAIDDIRNAIYQRMTEIKRIGGSESYQSACLGYDNGVDLYGNSMNSFIGCKVLPELLVMGKVGIYVDMPEISGASLLDNLHSRPYLYIFAAEDILSWDYNYHTGEYTSVLLQVQECEYHEETGFPKGSVTYYRRFWKEDGLVWAQFYDALGDAQIDPILLSIPRIPFVCGTISNSLMKDIADYQIALMNLASSDIAFATKASFPFYVEQFDPQSAAMSMLKAYKGIGDFDETTDDGTQAAARTSSDTNIKLGISTGRRYPMGANAPEFIHPSTEPLSASMEKQKQLKEEIRQLLNLSLSNLKPQRASAESKQQDDTGLEAGMSYIGLVLQTIEQHIGAIWSMYENSKNPPTVVYPEKYQLKTESQKRQEADDLFLQIKKIPSITAQKELCKAATSILLSNKVSAETLKVINTEIDNCYNVTIEPEILDRDVELSLVSKELASKIRGYPDGEAEKAKKEFIERAQQIAEAQSSSAEPHGGKSDPGARGVKDLSVDPDAGRKEKAESRDTTFSLDDTPKVRGKGK